MTGRAADVLVVGGGPAGSATAHALARAGVDVLVLDRARFPRDKPCAEYLSPEASRILAGMGALQAVEAAGAAQLTGMRVRAPSGEWLHGRFTAHHGFRGFRDRGLALRRTILDSILLDCARAAGARVLEGAHVTDLVRATDGRITGVVARNGEAHGSIRARFVVGADGLRSIVARRLGVARRSRWPERVALVAHYAGVTGMAQCGEMHVAPDGYLGLAPVDGGLTNVAVVVPSPHARALAGRSDEFLSGWIARDAILREMFSRAERIGSVRATGPFAARSIVATSREGGAALVGDAADFFDPFTGEGIYAAMRGSELLAPFVLESLAAPNREPDALRAYDAARKREFGGKWIVERAVAVAVARPALMNRATRALARRTDLADLLVGVIGDFVPPRELLRARFLVPLLAGSV